MKSGAQFRAVEFYDPASPEFAEEFDRIRKLGGADSKIRTPEQSEIALFWEDGLNVVGSVEGCTSKASRQRSGIVSFRHGR